MQTEFLRYPEPLLLASGSPRRIEMLSSLGFTLVVLPPDVDESVFDHLPIPLRVAALAESKVRASSALAPSPPRWAVAADTLVSIDGMTFGKASDKEEARAMISALAGRTHAVSSGLCVLDRRSGAIRSAVSETLITFAPLSDHEIDDYISCGEWIGVAGAYRAQERGAFLIERLEGSFSGVVGLPLREFYAMLSGIGYPFQFGTGVDSTE